MQAANQFTPDQLIVAGRRAEAQGQPAYALQFYRYVADHFPTSTEAYEARDALYRLTNPAEQPVAQRPQPNGYAPPAPPQAQLPPQTLPPPHAATQQHPPPAHQPPHPGTQSRPSQASLGDVRPHHEPAQPEPASRQRAERPKSRARAAPQEAEAYEDSAARPARGYRIGRIVAAMLNTIGWLSLVGAVLLVPLMIAALTASSFPKGLKETIAGNILMVSGVTFGLLLLGLFAIFAAQVARATFDTADSVRALYDANAGG